MNEGKLEPFQLAAMFLGLNCVRNSPLEDLHAGRFPRSGVGDYSDVKVVTPYGEIPWNELGRISDEEMKHLMIWVVDALYTVLSDNPDQPEVMLMPPPTSWNPPKKNDGFLMKDPEMLATMREYAKDHVVTVRQMMGTN